MSTKVACIVIVLLSCWSADANGDSVADGSYLKPVVRQYPGSQQYRYYPVHGYSSSGTRQKDDHYRYTGSESSPYMTKAVYPTKVQSVDAPPSEDYTQHSTDSWVPSWNGTHVRYVRPSYHASDTVEASHSMYQYQHVRSPSYLAYKKPAAYFTKTKVVKAPEKPKPSKKPQYYYSSPTGYKKTVYPRIHSPYTMHKYPAKKTVHPYYRRYYQSQYSSPTVAVYPSSDMLRSKVKNIYSEGYGYAVETSTTIPPTYTTTDRMYNTDDRNDYPVTSEDYSGYNDTYPSRSNGYNTYYDNYEEEAEQTTHEPTAADESSTRGYYGDRVYMSAQVPSQSGEKGMKHRLYIVRSEPEEEDDHLDTIFD